MNLALHLLKLVDWTSHALPRRWTGAPTIAGEPLDPLLHWLLSIKAKSGNIPLDQLQPAEVRRALRKDLINMRVGYPVKSVRDMQVPGAVSDLNARHYSPPDALACGALMVYFHGGGFVYGDLETHDDLCRLLCLSTGAQVLSVDYRLAPEHPFPAAVNDAIAVTRWALNESRRFGLPAHRVLVGGDSAGGNIATVAAQEMARLGLPLAAQLLFYPGTDYPTERPSRQHYSDGLFLSTRDRTWSYKLYLQDADPHDPRISPLNGSLAGIAPAVLVTANLDVLRDEGLAYAQALQAQGALIAHVAGHGLGHGFANLTSISSTAEEVVKAAGTRLRLHLSR